MIAMKKHILIFILFAAAALTFFGWQAHIFLFSETVKTADLRTFVPHFTGETNGIKQVCLIADSLPIFSLQPEFSDSLQSEEVPVLLMSAKTAKKLHLKDSLTAVVFDADFRYPYFFRLRFSDKLSPWECRFHYKAHDKMMLKKSAKGIYCIVFKNLHTEKDKFWQAEKTALAYLQENDLQNKFRAFKKLYYDF